MNINKLSNKLIFIKSITWRLIGSTATSMIAFYFGIPVSAIGLVFFADLFLKLALYYFHEKLWIYIIQNK